MMAQKSLLRLSAFMLGMLLLIPTSGPTALAMEMDTPEDVTQQFGKEALLLLHDSKDDTISTDDVPSFAAAASFGQVKRIYGWDADFTSGRSSELVVAPLDEWLAPILDADGEVLGTYRVWRPSPHASAEYAGYNNDITLAARMSELDASASLIEDPMSGGWFALADGQISALNENAAMEVPYPAPPQEVVPVIEKRITQSIIESADEEGAAGSGGPIEDRRPWFSKINPALGVGAALIMAGVLGAIWVVARSRRMG